MKVIIVGGVAGGASAAARLRRLNETAEITIYEKSGYISYANCGLPYYIGGVITDKNDLTLQTPTSFYYRFNISVKTLHEVIDIDTQNKTVTVVNITNQTTFTDSYDKLVLSPGAKAIKPNIKGVELNNVFTLRNIEDTYKIDNYIKSNKSKSAVIVGGGFIGIEMAENLQLRGLDVTIVEAMPQVLSILDSDIVSFAHAELRENGVNLALNKSIVSFENNNDKTICTLNDGSTIIADIVILAIGVTPDTSLATKANLKIGIKGSIVVNEKMETSAPDIYAVGDAVEVVNYITKTKALIPLAGPANKQGRIVADNINGGNSKYNGSQGSSVLKLFDMTVATTGINERQAKDAKINFQEVIISPASHASYYPGGKVMTIKVLFEKETNRLLGGQILGYDGVDKRIDILATAIRAGLKATDLAELELSYAPPYSSAKDPINMIGFVAENIVSGKIKQFYYENLTTIPLDGSVTLLDTRTNNEYGLGHVKGFINIPVDSLRERIVDIPKDKPVYVMCQSGIRSYIACRILISNGYDCYNFAGGYRYYLSCENEKTLSNSCYDCGKERL